jgi:DNA-binding NtrC family response regulator
VREPGAPLRVLLVEDSENDALLLLRELRRGGYEPLYELVSTSEAMERALGEASSRGEPWEVVVSDYYMPRFGALAALELLQRLGYDTPFVVVSGKIGEDAAVAMMRAGAQDYVAKEDMLRLCPAIERELREAEGRRERKRAAEALRFLSEASAELTSSLDYRATLAGEDSLMATKARRRHNSLVQTG